MSYLCPLWSRSNQFHYTPISALSCLLGVLFFITALKKYIHNGPMHWPGSCFFGDSSCTNSGMLSTFQVVNISPDNLEADTSSYHCRYEHFVYKVWWMDLHTLPWFLLCMPKWCLIHVPKWWMDLHTLPVMGSRRSYGLAGQAHLMDKSVYLVFVGLHKRRCSCCSTLCFAVPRGQQGQHLDYLSVRTSS